MVRGHCPPPLVGPAASASKPARFLSRATVSFTVHRGHRCFPRPLSDRIPPSASARFGRLPQRPAPFVPSETPAWGHTLDLGLPARSAPSASSFPHRPGSNRHTASCRHVVGWMFPLGLCAGTSWPMCVLRRFWSRPCWLILPCPPLVPQGLSGLTNVSHGTNASRATLDHLPHACWFPSAAFLRGCLPTEILWPNA
jgi:hypothetical protein